jgi:hypothetical protein
MKPVVRLAAAGAAAASVRLDSPPACHEACLSISATSASLRSAVTCSWPPGSGATAARSWADVAIAGHAWSSCSSTRTWPRGGATLGWPHSGQSAMASCDDRQATSGLTLMVSGGECTAPLLETLMQHPSRSQLQMFRSTRACSANLEEGPFLQSQANRRCAPVQRMLHTRDARN